MRLRKAVSTDIDALYAISLATGDKGQDASALYDDPEMMGHIYSAPYLSVSPSHCMVAVSDTQVIGFVVGTPDTAAFETQLETDWWPQLRGKYPDPSGIPKHLRTLDQRRAAHIHHPPKTPAQLLASFPAHMHLNLAPCAQGQGVGPRLALQWLEQLGPRGVHVGVNASNMRGLRFWNSLGFETVKGLETGQEGQPDWLGLRRALAHVPPQPGQDPQPFRTD